MKAITPAVAIILLLLVTISIVGFAFMFFTRATQTAAEAGEKEIASATKLSAADVTVEYAKTRLLIIKNLATTPADTSGLTFFVDGI